MKMDNAVLRVAAVTFLTLGTLAGGRANGSSVSPIAGSYGGEKHELSASDLKTKLDNNQNVIILDTRKKLYGEIIKGAIHVQLIQIEEWAKGADKDKLIVAYCACTHDETSQAAVHTLRWLGFENAYSLAGGLAAARKAGLEVVATTE